MERIKEQIRIATIFTPGRLIKPVWFDWHNRKHAVLETTYTWSDLKGSSRRLHFAVRDAGGLYARRPIGILNADRRRCGPVRAQVGYRELGTVEARRWTNAEDTTEPRTETGPGQARPSRVRE